MKVLVTGVTGFVGRSLAETLDARGHAVCGAARRSPERAAPGIKYVRVDAIDAGTSWRKVLAGMEVVVHCAARVHVMGELAADPLVAFRAVNVDGTLALARQAAAAGVRRFVFLSSVKVNGEGREAPYRENDPAAPQDAYAASKWEAEQGLREITARTGLEVVILRPPLVYGPGVKANFLSLMRAVDAGWPLPLGAVRNRRSLLYLGNLVDAILACLQHPGAAGQTFVLADGAPLSTAELVSALAEALGRPARLLAVPPGVMQWAAKLLGRGDTADRLLGSLWVDDCWIREHLDWCPPFSLEDGLRETARAYRDARRHTALGSARDAG